MTVLKARIGPIPVLLHSYANGEVSVSGPIGVHADLRLVSGASPMSVRHERIKCKQDGTCTHVRHNARRRTFSQLEEGQ